MILLLDLLTVVSICRRNAPPADDILVYEYITFSMEIKAFF